MKKILGVIVCLILISSASFAYIRDARLDKGSFGFGCWDNGAQSERLIKQDIENQVFYEALIDKDSSFGLLISRRNIIEEDFIGLFAQKTVENNDFYYEEVSYNRNFFRNDYFASAWVLGAYYYEYHAGGSEIYPNLGVALSYKPLPFMYLRANLVLIRMFGFSAAFDLPYNLELEAMYYANSPIIRISYKL